MSDLNQIGAKVAEGAEWRGTINVEFRGDNFELTVRQLTDPEYHEVMNKIDRDELQALQNELPSDKMQEYRDLQAKDELDEEDEARMEELREQIEENSSNPFQKLSTETFNGIRQAAKYGVVPDEEDKREAFTERAPEIEREYGIKVEQPDDVEPALQDEIDEMIDNATGFLSFNLGVAVLSETVGKDEGN